MTAIKPLSTTANKWARVSALSTPAYEDGVRNPRKDWADETTKAAANYSAGVQAAVADGRFERGVQNAGTSKWQRNAIEKGPERYRQGVGLAKTAYAAGFAPYREVIAALDLPERRPTGDPANIDRVRVVASALHAKKREMLGGV